MSETNNMHGDYGTSGRPDSTSGYSGGVNQSGWCRAGEARRAAVPPYRQWNGAPAGNGYGMPPQMRGQAPQPVVRNQSNGIGTAGFVVSLIACMSGMFLVPAAVLWIVGLVLSSIGMTRSPRGLAIAGFVISLVPLLVLLVLLMFFGMAAVFS